MSLQLCVFSASGAGRGAEYKSSPDLLLQRERTGEKEAERTDGIERACTQEEKKVERRRRKGEKDLKGGEVGEINGKDEKENMMGVGGGEKERRQGFVCFFF